MCRRTARLLRVGLVSTALSAAVALPGAHAAPGDDAFSLLSAENVVTGAARRPQPLDETPSAVSVIPAAEIRAMGYRTLADALRWVQGLYVSDDRNYSYVGVWGISRPGDYNNRILLTLDGHPLNGHVYGDAAFGEELGLDMESVERIEVVRGPGSALYGSNALLAVVNVVTRSARREPGLWTSARIASAGERRAFARWAWAPEGGPEWWVSSSWLARTGRDLYYGEFDDPLTSFGRARGVDGEDAVAFLGGAEWKGVRLSAKFNRREKNVPTAAYGTRFADAGTVTVDGHNFVALETTRSPSSRVELNGRLFWDAPRYEATYAYEYAGVGRVLNRDIGDGDQIGAELRTYWSAGRQDVFTLGLEARHRIRSWMYNRDEDPEFVFYDVTRGGRAFGVYIQDEHDFGGRLRVTGGARLDADPDLRPVWTPRFDATWRMTSATSVKALGGSAFRAPSPYEAGVDPAARPRPLTPERVISYEASLQHDVAGSATVDLTVFQTRMRDLIELVGVDSLGFTSFDNVGRLRTHGLAIGTRWADAHGRRARLTLAWQNSDDPETGMEVTNSPHWNAHAVVLWSPPRGPWTIGLGSRVLSSRPTLVGSRTSNAWVTDAHVARLVGDRTRVGIEVRNLFDARYGDPASVEHAQSEITQDPRTFSLTFSWLR